MNFRFRLMIAAVFVISIVGLNSIIHAQDNHGQTLGQYERKSISYIPAVYIQRSEAYKMKNKEIDYLVDRVRQYIEMPRFDFNKLPEEITNEFVRRAHASGHITPDEMENLLNQTVVPVITDILNTQMEIRARNLVSEEQKQQFIATKAQSYGITADQLEKVLNSAYIYVPYVDKVDFSEKKGVVTSNVQGGLLWYHVDMSGTQPRVESILKQTTHSMGKGLKKRHYTFKGHRLDGEGFALYTAVDNFARNLQVATQSIPAFKLSAQVSYVKNNKVDFNLGRKEGIKVDDIFYITEQVMKNGDVKQKRVGAVRTVKVANNKKNSYENSQAVAITGHGYAQGMALVEHPRLPIDIVVRPRVHNLELSTGSIGPIHFYDAYSGPTGGVDLEAHYHIGRWFNSPLLLFSIGGTVSFVPAKIQIDYFNSYAYTIPALYQVHLGLTKKYFYRRVGWTISAKFGTAFLDISQDVGDHTIGISNHTVGGIFQSGLELAVTPDFYMGIYGGYQYYPESFLWTLDIDHDSIPLSSDINQPSFNASGATFGIYFHFQPPSLSFDPINMVRGVSGI